MSRLVRRLDRVVTLLAGVAIFALGLLLFAWSSRSVSWLPWPGFVRDLPESVQIDLIFEDAAWWPWALLAGGLVAILVALRWLVAHLSLRRVGYLTLPDDLPDDTDPTGSAGEAPVGRLLVQARSAVDAAALSFNHRPGVETAVGSLETVDGVLVARVNATLSADADLAQVAADADHVSGLLRSVLGREDLRMTYVLRSVPVRVGRVE